MATLTPTSQLSLVELAKRHHQGDLQTIAEVLTKENPLVADAIWLEANDTFSNKTVKRAALPTGSWRDLNAGVATEASQTIEVSDVIGMLESYAEADKDLVDAASNPGEMRMQEAMAFIQGMGETLTSTMLYGNNATTSNKFTGLAPRLGTINSETIIGNSGTGSDVTSIYVVTWDRMGCHMIYPKGDPQVGIRHWDLGEDTKYDGNSNPYQIYRDRFQIKCGMVVRDDRFIGRLANIETSGATNTFDEDNLIKVLTFMKTGANTRIYVNQTIYNQMMIRLKDKNNVNYTADGGNGLSGEPIVRFLGFPIHRVDNQLLLNTETAIS